MRSLFLKIFLWFWLTMLLIALAFVFTWSTQPEVVLSRWRAVTGDALTLYAVSAAEIYDREGPAGVAAYLQRLEQRARIRAYLFDEQLQPLSGNPSPQVGQLAQRAQQSGQAEFENLGRTTLGAQRATGPSGHRYVLVAEMPRGPLGPFRAAPRTQLLRWALAILISGLICYWLTRYLAGPILRLRTAARQLAAGNMAARAGEQMEKRRDEIGDLVRDFNRMAERIEGLLNFQRQLISDISHELRSPLARLNVALGLARQRAGPEASAPLDRIEREAERLNDLIGKLLTLARLESASGPPEIEPVRLDELVREIAADAAFEARSRQCDVKVTAAEACTAIGSPELLRSAIENVVRNAVRYTAEGSEVEIELACTSQDGARWAVIRVRDHGPGVPEPEVPNLFQPFYRVANARERQTGGTGLGLAITERAVRLHRGAVKASNPPGGVLLVEIRIPASIS